MAGGKIQDSPLLKLGFVLGLTYMTIVGQCHGALKVNYYYRKCGKTDVEKVVYKVVKARWQKNKNVVANLIRLQFHDCFVRGCDASILLDGKNTEKTAVPNGSVGGYDIIDEAKASLEKKCPGVVSCADIIVIAARAALVLGGSHWYEVETGRRDSRVSIAKQALKHIPEPAVPIHRAIQEFARRGLNTEDFVVLVGSHTVGTAHCVNYQDRLWNFHGSMRSDPTMSRNLRYYLMRKCPLNANSTNEVFLDQTVGCQNTIDNGYYRAILRGQGILEIDQQLATSSMTMGRVQRLAYTDEFVQKIGPSMVKMGRIGVLTGHRGEIRISCHRINH